MVISEMVYAKIHSQLKLAVRIMKKCNSLSISQVFSAEVLLKLVFIKGENTTKKLTVFWEGDFSFLFKQSGVMEGAPMAGVLDLDDLSSPFQPKPFHYSMLSSEFTHHY